MNNYMKTIISGLMQWVSAQITKSKSDWNQSDPNAENYVKNKTHYSYKTEVVLLPASNIIEEEKSGLGFASIDGSSFIIEVGKSYKVTLDGVSYICVAYTDTSATGSVILGNFTIVEALSNSSGHINTGEPFVLMHVPTYGMLAIYTPTVDTHILSIAGVTEVVKTLDEKYLPEGYVSYTKWQNLSEYDKALARDNIGAGTSYFSGDYTDLTNKPTIYTDVVRHGVAQSLTDVQKERARENIGAGTSNFSGSYNDLTDIPEIAQANWSQNDSTQPDYIVNRTHYVAPVETELLNSIAMSTTATGDNAVAYWHAGLDLTFDTLPLNDDTIIKFIRTGVASGPVTAEITGKVSHYSITTSGDYDYYVMGNQSLLNGLTLPAFQMDFGAHEDTGEAYAIVIEVHSNNGSILDDYPRVYVVSDSAWGSSRLKIYLINDTVVKLDPKYLPIATDDEILEMLAQEDMLPVVADSDGSLLTDETNNILLW